MKRAFVAAVLIMCVTAICMLAGCGGQPLDVWQPSDGPIYESAEYKGILTRQDTPSLDYYSYILANSEDVTDDVIAEWYYATVGVDSYIWYMIEFADKSQVGVPGKEHFGVYAKYGAVYTGATLEMISYGDKYGFDEYKLVSYEKKLKPDGNGGLTVVEGE